MKPKPVAQAELCSGVKPACSVLNWPRAALADAALHPWQPKEKRQRKKCCCHQTAPGGTTEQEFYSQEKEKGQ